jgi:membrane protein YdbS with pleckstrin-like domain
MSAEEPHEPERTLWTGRRSQWFYLGHWLIGLLIVAAIAAGSYYYQNELSRWMPWAYGIPVLSLLIVMAVIAIARGQRSYRVTNRRVISVFGRVVKDTNEIRIQDIRSMNVTKGGFSGFMGIGKVEFSSAATDDADVIFYQIAGADRVRDLVRKLQS